MVDSVSVKGNDNGDDYDLLIFVDDNLIGGTEWNSKTEDGTSLKINKSLAGKTIYFKAGGKGSDKKGHSIQNVTISVNYHTVDELQCRPVCKPNVTCGPWSSCQFGQQTQVCTDSNGCQPQEIKTQACCTIDPMIPPSCGPWDSSQCSSTGQMTRTCSDNCGNPASQSQTCCLHQNPYPVAVDNAYIPDKATRLSPANQLEIGFQHNSTDTNYDGFGDGVGNQVTCNSDKYIIEITKKTDPSLLKYDDCDWSKAVRIERDATLTKSDPSIKKVNLKDPTIITDASFINWNTSYCWRVTAQNNQGTAESDSDPLATGNQPFTFRTNLQPNLIRAGIEYQNGNIDAEAIAPKRELNVGNALCTQGVTAGCSVPIIEPDGFTKIFGGDKCWSGKFEYDMSKRKTDNPMTFWFEYEDKDNYDNYLDSSVDPKVDSSKVLLQDENWKHVIAFVNSNVSISDAESGYIGGKVKENAILYFETPVNSINPGENIIQTSKQGVNISDIADIDVQKFADEKKRIRLKYTITFKEKFDGGMYNIYSLYLSQVNGDSALPIGDRSGTQVENALFTLRGKWGVDNNGPEGDIEAVINGYNSFSIRWNIIDASGDIMPNFKATCSSSGDSTIEGVDNSGFVMKYVGPTAPLGSSLSIKKDEETSCINPGDVEKIIQKHNVGHLTQYSLVDPTNPSNPYYYKNFDNLVVRLSEVQDMACNQTSEAKSMSMQIHEHPWIATRQGSVFSSGFQSTLDSLAKDGISVNVPSGKLVSPKEKNDFVTFDGSKKIQLFKSVPEEIVNISTNFLGSGTTINPKNSSQTNQQLTGYPDQNGTPTVLSKETSWYEFLSDIVGTKGVKLTPSSTNVITKISDLTNGFSYKDIFVYKTNGSLTIDKTGNFNAVECSQKSIVFVGGDLIIKDDIRSTGSENGCLFIVKGAVNFETAEAPKDMNNKDANRSNTAFYDELDAMIISDGGINIKLDNQTPDSQSGIVYADGMYVNGNLITTNFKFERDLGLRNLIQPSVFMIFDPKYLYIYDDLFLNNILQIREKGYSN